MSESGGKPVQAFFGALLIGVGALIAGLCGLCTAIGLIASATAGGGDPYGGPDVAMLAIVVGGLPTLIGVGLFFAGRRLLRGAEPPKPIVRLDDAP